MGIVSCEWERCTITGWYPEYRGGVSWVGGGVVRAEYVVIRSFVDEHCFLRAGGGVLWVEAVSCGPST